MPDLKPAPNTTNPTVNWVAPACRLPSITKDNKFRFLNIDGDLSEIGWDGPQQEKLWRYNQHYFDDLNSINADERNELHIKLIQDWIKSNPPGFGTGWEPYPVSLRIVNLVKWAIRKNKLSNNTKQSLAIQLRWLMKNLEIHLLGNHLFSNAKALVFGGLFFDGKEADKWLKKGLGILHKEIKQQILPDGGHFELSTMYHAIAFEDVLDLINITKTFSGKLSSEQKLKISSFYGLAKSMHNWLKYMCHPDGEISFFNDSAFGVAPSFAELDEYSKRLKIESSKKTDENITFFKDSGYLRIKNGSTVAIIDVAKIGPDYLPGHAHADTLSFELSIDKQRILVNSGTSCYGISKERLRQRGTRAHNTVVINGENSSEVWGGFRVAKRATPFNVRVEQSEDADSISVWAAHDGYKKIFKSHVIHRRNWEFKHNNLTISDKIEGRFKRSEVRFHFHPDVVVKVERPINFSVGTILLKGDKKIEFSTDGSARLFDSTWHPSFGFNQKSKVISVFFEKDEVNTIFSWR